MESKDGRIELVIGPMFSGKSTELIRRIRRYDISKKKCLVFKYDKDTRYEEGEAKDLRYIKSHNKESWAATPSVELMNYIEAALTFDVIGIDEGQFFTDIIEFAETLAGGGKIVIVAALDGDYLRRPFGKICELTCKAEDVIKLKAVCKICCKDASFTKRTVISDKLELIGGAESYIPTCRECHVKL